MRITITSLVVLLLLPLLILSRPASALELNGSAVYTHLNRDYYLAGLYLPTSSNDLHTIFSAATAKRMQLIMRMQNWSPRRWSEHWQNNIAINNDDSQTDEQLQQALLSFMQFPRGDLIYNDEVIIEYQAHGNSRVLLNGELVLEVPGTEFINQILKTWLGKLPPSRDFRQQILSADSITAARRDLLTRHLRERPHLWSSWLAVEQAEQLRQQQEQDRLAQAAKVAELQRLAREQEIAFEQQRLAAAQQAQLEHEQAADNALRKAAQQQAHNQAQTFERTQETSIEQQTQLVVAADQGQEPSKKIIKVISQQQRYFLEMLQWQLQRQLEALVEYPIWAKEFGQQGLIEVDFILKRNRETEQQQARNPHAPQLLTAELNRVIQIAAEKTPIPERLAGESWPIAVHYQFSLIAAEQPKLTMPKAPSALIKEARQHNSSDLLAHYQQQLTERIKNAMYYPFAEKTLAKKDEVQAQLMIAADGTLKSIKHLKTAEHPEFDQALADAIKRSQPFPPLPLALTEKEISIEFQYQFQR